MTKAQRQALEWLCEHNGTGIFDRNGVLLAAGELAPFTRSTWNALRDIGHVAIVKGARGPARVTIKSCGVIALRGYA